MAIARAQNRALVPGESWKKKAAEKEAIDPDLASSRRQGGVDTLLTGAASGGHALWVSVVQSGTP